MNLFDIHGLFKDSSVFNELESNSTGDVITSNSLYGSPMSCFQLWRPQILYARNLGLEACHLKGNQDFDPQSIILLCSPTS